jgi:LacI family transcriptional regulator
MTVTLSDVAERAGASLATVSRVLTGSSHPVREAMRARVLEAAAELGYRPNPIARALTHKLMNTIGVVVGDITDSYFAEIARGLEDIARTQGYLTIVCNADRNPTAEVAYFRMLMEHQAAGILFAGGVYPNAPAAGELKQAVASAVAAGTTTRIMCLAERDIDCVPVVCVDNHAVMYDMATDLIRIGHRRIAYVEGPEGLSTSIQRRAGFQAAMRDADLDASLIFLGCFGIESGRVAATVMLTRELPDAVIAATDETAIGILVTLRQAGIAVPRQISVAGVDDTKYAQLMDLTTVRLPTYELGSLAARQILSWDEQPPAPRTILSHRIMHRGSTTWVSHVIAAAQDDVG